MVSGLRRQIEKRMKAIEDLLATRPDPSLRPETAEAGLASIDAFYDRCGDLELARQAMWRRMDEAEAVFAAGGTTPMELDDGDRDHILTELEWDGVQRAHKPCNFTWKPNENVSSDNVIGP
jgi:hypothetical protein